MKGFDKLDIDSKAIMLHHQGQMLASIMYYNYRVNLFAFGRGLVEEYYDTETHEVSRICSARPSDLNKYADRIDIRDLVH